MTFATTANSSSSNLEGKRILIVGAERGAWSVNYFRAARKAGAHVCVALLPEHEPIISKLLANETPSMSSGVHIICTPNLFSGPTYEDISETILKGVTNSDDGNNECRSSSKPFFDGCVTFQDNHVQLAAELCNLWSLPGCDPTGVSISINKYAFRRKLLEHNMGLAYCATMDDFVAGKSPPELKFPVVLKPSRGHGSQGIYLVNSLKEMKSKREEYERDFPGRFELWMVEEFLTGPELGVELIMNGGECVFSSVMETPKTPPPTFQGTGRFWPSSLGREKDDAIVRECVAVSKLLGLTNSVLDIDAKFLQDGRGPVILEINCRMGGHSVALMQQEVFGVDLITEMLRCGCNVPHGVSKGFVTPKAAYAKLVLSEKSGVLRKLTFDTFLDSVWNVLPENKKSTLKAARLGVQPGTKVKGGEGIFPAIMAFVVAEADTVAEAEEKAIILKKYASKLVSESIMEVDESEPAHAPSSQENVELVKRLS